MKAQNGREMMMMDAAWPPATRRALGVKAAVPLALLITVAGILPANAQSQGRQATLTLRATVAAECSIGISTSSATVNLVAGQTQFPVATVQERCNAANGYVVNVASQNGGRLAGAGAGVNYTLHYGDQDAANSGSLTANRAVSGDARTTTLAVSVPASPNLPAGDYEDVVVISITAK